jgi:hypothetical protein
MILQHHRRLTVSIFSVKTRSRVFESGYWKDWLHGKISQELTCHRQLPECFTEPQAASCKHFHCQNPLYGVYEAGYWKDYLVGNFKEQATLSLTFFLTK